MSGTTHRIVEQQGNLCQRPAVFSESLSCEVERRYQAIVLDPKYAHFVHIPDRIVRCLKYFRIVFDPSEVWPRLLSYYLFIGVADDAIDSGQLNVGEQILEHFGTRPPCFNQQTLSSSVSLATEILKQEISEEVYPAALAKLHDLYKAVADEQQASTMSIYIEQREIIGSRTAELSYLLIRPFLSAAQEDFCRFMQQVGAVGCLVDSVIDLQSDSRLGLLSFRPSIRDTLNLIFRTARRGLSIWLRHPTLLRLFAEAVGDNIKDRFRTKAQSSLRSFAVFRKEHPASVA